MKFRFLPAVGSALLTAGLIAGAATAAAPANADTTNANDFLSALSAAGITDIPPGDAVALGQSVCPLLAEHGQNTADVAATVANTMGKPLGPATMFTGLAIASFCPGAVTSLANGNSPIPLGILNGFGM